MGIYSMSTNLCNVSDADDGVSLEPSEAQPLVLPSDPGVGIASDNLPGIGVASDNLRMEDENTSTEEDDEEFDDEDFDDDFDDEFEEEDDFDDDLPEELDEEELKNL